VTSVPIARQSLLLLARLLVALAVALHTGFRRGNCFRLRWAEDIDFDAGRSAPVTRKAVETTASR